MSKRKRTLYSNNPSEEEKKKVFFKGNKVKGKNSDKYRRDAYGKIIYYASYGKDSAMGWNRDHIIPLTRGGSHDITNLQPLNSSINKSKGNSLKKKVLKDLKIKK